MGNGNFEQIVKLVQYICHAVIRSFFFKHVDLHIVYLYIFHIFVQFIYIFSVRASGWRRPNIIATPLY